MLNAIIVNYNKIIKNRFEWYSFAEKNLIDLEFNNSINCSKA